ncbi:hypothetical protein N7509_006297 [Penicillium cosmopolitanum]|uniref:TMEM205-like domain-containing protein n=1 Tax=Penicillium cosmopolitanum TaxID=1131564 RepID=A0A9W9W3V0_9EURO|nr:uncharacterized protein N7509_006297 [Penicillium cosmopolitanum]KAJ5398184.1 hypothetical protein N7509_006297 [Penicillium cosmopolitanum]
MREFLTLQKRVFPVYFASQVGLVVLTAATHPPYSIISLMNDLWSAGPLLVVLGTGGLNWAIYGPRTTTTSLVRKAVHDAKEKQQGDQLDDEGKVHRANKEFSFNHAMSIHLNAISLVATIWYGFTLSSSLLEGL